MEAAGPTSRDTPRSVTLAAAAACIVVAERYPFMPLDEPMRTAV
jgi:hypothetical protein